MYKVAGSNLFGQWLSKDIIFDHFRAIDKILQPSKSKLACLCWSYNIFQVDDKLHISGAFRGKQNQFTAIPIPEQFKNSQFLTVGNDYNFLIVGNKSNIIFVFDLKTHMYKSLSFVDYKIENDTDFDLQIVKVVMNNQNCMYLSSKGDVYCGMLPMHLDIRDCLGKVIDIVLGYEHAMLLTDTGRVYTWGNGRRLQLGHGDINNLDFPTEVKALSGIKIVKICAGGWHSCALSEFGDLYIWGWNDTGQLGVKETANDTFIQSFGFPTLVDVFDERGEELQLNVKDVACGSRHTAILLEDGSVWTSGCNKYGQLGLCVKSYLKVDCFKKSYTCSGDCDLICGPWTTIVLET